MNPRFPVLSFFSIVFRTLGWLVLAGGLIYSLRQAIDLAHCLPRCSVDIPQLLPNVGLLLTGAFVVIIGELIGVAFAIEKNTFKMAEQIDKNKDS